MKRSKFSLSHYKLLTGNQAELIPVSWYEILPGDTIQQSTSALLRLSPLLAPCMHPIRVRFHSWFVPYRIIWDDWEDFFTGGEDGLQTPTWPNITFTTITESSLEDHLGVMPGSHSSFAMSALPFRAYAKIFNDYYRDQQLVTALTIDTSSGSDSTTNRTLQSVSWEKDYFTTCRSSKQLGTAVTVSIGGQAEVHGIGKHNQTFGLTNQNVYETGGSGTTQYASASQIMEATHATNNQWYGEEDPNNTGYPGIYADLTSATGMDINTLRESFGLQKYMERMNKYGARYVEYLRSLGVRSNKRPDEATYLGGGRQVISISEILSTDDDDSSNYAGKLRGHGISAMRTNRWRKYFDEHGICMTLMSVLPKTIYTQGMHRSFRKQTKEEYWQRELQYIGDQDVYNYEVYLGHTSKTGTFGYQNKYDEYRYHPSSISGGFRSGLNHWHMGRIYGSSPALNSTFVTASPTDRIYASTTEDQLYVMANQSIQARRLVGPTRAYSI